MRTVAGKEREAEEGEELSGGVIAKLRALVHADTERVCVLAAILLCLLDKRDNQVSHSTVMTTPTKTTPTTTDRTYSPPDIKEAILSRSVGSGSVPLHSRPV